MDMFDKINKLNDKRKKLEAGGGKKRIQKQHEKGKLTARERIDHLLDKGSFVELNPFRESSCPSGSVDKEQPDGEGVVTGYGEIEGIPVYIYSQDFTVYGGSLGEAHAQKIAAIMDKAAANGFPIIGLNDSGGARIQEGVSSLDGYGHIFYRNAIYSGIIPQISVILGPCAGGAVYSPALTDFIIMVEDTSQMFITGPKVIESVTGERISAEKLGGASIHNSQSGNAHFKAKTEEEALHLARELISYLPNKQNNMDKLPKNVSEADFRGELAEIVPFNPTKPYDVKKVVEQVADSQSFIEVQADFAKNIVIGFAKMHGKTVGFVCNQPKFLAGSLDIDASDKAARFIRFCDAFEIPIITLEDVTGFYPGVTQEHGGIIRHGAKILFAYSEATVPKITVILRKAYGGAYVALNSKSIGADLVFAWPNAEIAVMGPESAVNILDAEEIKKSDSPEKTRQQKIKDYREKFASPYIAAGLGMVDDVIDPRQTRTKLVQSLRMLENKQEKRPYRKHGNIPL